MVLLVKNLPASTGDIRDIGFDPWVEKIPWRRAWQHSSLLAWKIPWTELPDELQSTGSQRSDTTEATKHAHMHHEYHKCN